MDNSKVCTKCKRTLTLDKFYKKKRLLIISYYSECKECWNARSSAYNKAHKPKVSWYSRNKDTINIKQKFLYDNNINGYKDKKHEYAKKYKDIKNEKSRKRNYEKKRQFLVMYGGKCACCGETVQEFLTLEHKNGQRGIARSKKQNGKWSYEAATKEFRPDLYEILCWNCNCSKGRYGYCPHHI